MNRRQLGFGIATTAMAATASAVAQNAAPRVEMTPGVATRWSAAFNAQIARLPETIQGDVRAFYELNGWRPVWTVERMRALNAAAARAERHGLPTGDFFDFIGLASDPDSGDVRTTASALTYARVLAEGRVRPETVEDLWEMQKNRVDLPMGLNDAMVSNQIVEWYDGLAPTDIGYAICRPAMFATAAWRATAAGQPSAREAPSSPVPATIACRP